MSTHFERRKVPRDTEVLPSRMRRIMRGLGKLVGRDPDYKTIRVPDSHVDIRVTSMEAPSRTWDIDDVPGGRPERPADRVKLRVPKIIDMPHEDD